MRDGPYSLKRTSSYGDHGVPGIARHDELSKEWSIRMLEVFWRQ